MKLATGTIIGGKVVLPGEPLRNGTIVTVLAREDDESFDIPAEVEAALDQSLSEAARGDTLSAEVVLRRLRKPRA